MKLKLIAKKKEAENTKSFLFEPEKEFDFLPGQYFYFTLPKLNYKDSRGATRHFTIANSPTEGKNIFIATRMRKSSGFKKTLDEMEIGSLIEGEGPSGIFVLDENDKGPHVFLAGGIGITPFRSIVKNVVDKKLKTPIHLIYSNSTPEQITFRSELEKWAKKSRNIRLDMTCSQTEGSKEKWGGLTGRIDENLIKKLVPDISKQTFWVCGPPAMVDAMEKALGKLRITSDKVHSEKFSGY